MTTWMWVLLFVGLAYLVGLAMWVSICVCCRRADHELTVDELWDEDDDLAESY